MNPKKQMANRTSHIEIFSENGDSPNCAYKYDKHSDRMSVEDADWKSVAQEGVRGAQNNVCEKYHA